MSWPSVKLGDIFKITSGGTPSRKKKEYYEGGTIHWVKTGDLHHKYVESASEFITQEGLDGSSTRLYPKGTVLLAMYGATIGACSILNVEACTNQACAAFTPNEKIDLEYFYYLMKDCKSDFVKAGSGGAQPNISASFLKEFEIPLPPLDEQKRIAAILDKADAIRRKRQQAIQLADDFLRSVFLDMFGDPVTNPKGWEVKNFSEVCKCSQGIQVDSELQKNSIENGYVKFLRIINYTQGSKEFKFIPAPFNDKALINQDEIVMVRYGATAGFVGRGLDGILANNLFKISFEKSVLDNEYFYYLLNSDYFQNILKNNKKGGAMPAISFGQLNEIKVMTPSLEIQSKFSHVVNVINNIKGGTLYSELLLNDNFNSLSQKAFAGEL